MIPYHHCTHGVPINVECTSAVAPHLRLGINWRINPEPGTQGAYPVALLIASLETHLSLGIWQCLSKNQYPSWRINVQHLKAVQDRQREVNIASPQALLLVPRQPASPNPSFVYAPSFRTMRCCSVCIRSSRTVAVAVNTTPSPSRPHQPFRTCLTPSITHAPPIFDWCLAMCIRLGSGLPSKNRSLSWQGHEKRCESSAVR